MPQTTVITYDQNFLIDPYIYKLDISMRGASGAGENVNTSLVSSAGGSGGSTSFLGVTVSGGTGGGFGGKNAGGNGGSTTISSTWTGLGVTFNNTTGGAGGFSNGGPGAGPSPSGGAGSNGFNTYYASMTHYFDNGTNEHNFNASSTTGAISLQYQNAGAIDGIFGTTPSNGKYYSLTFTQPYINSSWSYSIYSICQQSAGGGTLAPPYGLNGVANKTSNGMNIWFQNGSGANGYIRCFSISSTGIKSGAQGKGGGGGGLTTASILYTKLQQTGLYSPGSTVSASIGAGGSRTGTTGGTGNGTAGRIEVTETIFPQVYLIADKLFIKSGEQVKLEWTSQGDINAISWPNNLDVTNGNISSDAFVSPIETTTYQAVGYNTGIPGLVSYNPESSLTITVYQAPQLSVTWPNVIEYGVDPTITVTSRYINTELKLTATYNYEDATQVIEVFTLNTNGDAVDTPELTQDIIPHIDWSMVGPLTISMVMEGEGDGGEATIPSPVFEVEIDRLPDLINIPNSTDELPDADPVLAPDEETVITDPIAITGIDLPVEITANRPIQVKFDDDDPDIESNWNNLRQL